MGRHILLFFLATAAFAESWKTPVQIRKLSNGLRVVVSEDHTAPTVGLCVSYGIGFRLEPEGRTGFAHLFEHMMFEGTPNAPKGTMDRIVEGGGGKNNGDTRYDFTEYIETAPLSALEPLLWMEADRMKTLDFSPANLENQRKVVEEEVRMNVLNQPYGLFFALDLPEKAFDTYPNAHNFYGDFHDLDSAKIEDVRRFYERYYTPGNAVLAIVGDVKPDQVFALVESTSTPSRPVLRRPVRGLTKRHKHQNGEPPKRTNWRVRQPSQWAIACRLMARTTRSSQPSPESFFTTAKHRCCTNTWSNKSKLPSR